MKNKHTEQISLEKDMKIEIPMKNEHYKQLKKIEMMIKKNFQTGVEINVMKKKVQSLDVRNVNEFKELAQEYLELTNAALPTDFFKSLCANHTPSTASRNVTQAPTSPHSNKNEDLFQTEEPVDLFGNINDKAVNKDVDLFGDKIEEEDKQTIYKSYVQYYFYEIKQISQ